MPLKVGRKYTLKSQVYAKMQYTSKAYHPPPLGEGQGVRLLSHPSHLIEGLV